jgi:hypothetical protein
MTKTNFKKPFVTAVISSLLFAGAIVTVPLVASAQSGSDDGNEVIDTDKGKEVADHNNGKGKKEKANSLRNGKHGKKFHVLGEVIESLGLDRIDLRDGIKAGQTFGEIAEANGISSEAVVQTIVDVLTEKLNEAVSEGKITSDEALEKASHIRERAEETVNNPIGDGKGKKEKDNSLRNGKHGKGPLSDSLRK